MSPKDVSILPLDRSFVRVSQGQPDDWVSTDLLRLENPQIKWPQLLNHSCAVVLGEAGIGKTAELGQRVASIVKGGGFAFFLPLEAEQLKQKANSAVHQAEEEVHGINQARAHALRESSTLEADRATLNGIIPEIAAGTRFDVLRHLFARCRTEQPSAISFSAISDLYGAAVASAARDGFKAFWKTVQPTKIEEHPPHSVPYGASIGLIGIELDVSDGLDVSALPTVLQRRVIEYAPWELNGFPDWFNGVARDHATLVLDVLAPAIRLDYATPRSQSEPEPSRVLNKVVRASDAVRLACAPLLAKLLVASDPLCTGALSGTLDVVDGAGIMPSAQLVALSEERCRNSINDPPRFAVWWCQWLALDSTRALDAFEEILTKKAHPPELAEETFSCLWTAAESHFGETRLGLKRNRDALVRLIPIVYTHIRDTDEAVDDNRRDNCHQLRHALLPWLAGIEGTPTVDALERLAQEPCLSAGAEWIRHLADVRAIDDATSPPLTVKQAAALVRNLVIEPTTSAELFAIALNRLEDIRLTLENGDFSVRDFYNPPKRILEEPVQHLLAQRLQDARRTHYTVEREPEVTRKKKPDIRLANPRCEGPVTIELKIAERWTLPELEEAIRDQLVGLYMKANNSRYGVLVLCSSGRKKRWKQPPNTTPTLDFQGVAEHLRKYAADLASSTVGIAGLQVVTIDFH